MPIAKGFKRTDGDGDRQYIFDEDSYPSVTTILKYGLAKQGLEVWKTKRIIEAVTAESETISSMKPDAAVKYLLGRADPYTERQALKGDVVHAYAEATAFGHPAPLLTDDEKPYGDSYEKFLYDFAPEFHAVELPVFNKTYMYAGTVDIYAKINGRMCVVDIKTGKSIWPEVALQLAAYARSEFAVREDGASPSPIVERGYVLHVTADGYKLNRVDISDETFNVFLSALDIYNWYRYDSKYNIGGTVELPSDRENRVVEAGPVL